LQEVREIFAALDINCDGKISHAEFIKGLKANPVVAKKLGMVTPY
jgi:Ca2+-binding EF-hand superfamily protein